MPLVNAIMLAPEDYSITIASIENKEISVFDKLTALQILFNEYTIETQLHEVRDIIIYNETKHVIIIF